MNSAHTPLPEATHTCPVWLQVGTLIDGASNAVARNSHIVYDAGAIRYVGREGALPPRDVLREGQSSPDSVLPDFTLLPGLIEAHAHLFLEGAELDLERRAAYIKQSPAALLAAARERLAKLVHIGVIAVRDAGDKDGVGLALSRLYQSSDRPLMPYLDSPGAAIHHQGRYGSFMGEPLESFATLQACVENRVQAGADRIKLIPTGIINFKQGVVTTAPQMSTAEVAGLVAAARWHSRQTFAHASGDQGIEHAIEGGVDSVEHGFFIRDDQLARMRDRAIAWVPTFAPVQEQIDHAELMGWDAAVVANLRRIVERHAASLARAHALGVTIIAGSDAGSVGVAHGGGLLRELELMEAAGLSSLAVLNAATGSPAARLGWRERFGRVDPGWRPRFILTRHAPLDTVANLRRPRLVVFDGKVIASADRDDLAGM